MIVGIGTDIVEVTRIESSIKKYGERFLNRIFTESEQQYSESFRNNKYQHYAARFAAKEAFSKAIGTGITQGFKFREVGIRNQPNGKPNVVLSGDTAVRWGDCNIHVSLSHTALNAVAYIVIERK